MQLATQSHSVVPTSSPQQPLAEERNFLQGLRPVFGPGALLGRMFLAGDGALQRQQLTLSFGTFPIMARLNAQHYDTWGALVPIFDSRHAEIPEADAFCLFARDETGEVVGCQAARRISLAGTNLQAEANAGRLFYPNGLVPDGEQYFLEAPVAAAITGGITYSGGLWVHPSARRRQLGTILPRISRAYAHGLWNSDYVVSFAREALVQKGMIERYGYPHMARPFRRMIGGAQDFEGVLVWMTRDELLDDTGRMVAQLTAQVDVAVGHGGDQGNPATIRPHHRNN